MAKLKITIEDAKAELRDAAAGPHSQHWSYSPAIMALLNNHDELLAILGEATAALEEKDQRIKELSSVLTIEKGASAFEGRRTAHIDGMRDKFLKRAEAAEQREGHLKADAAVLGQRIVELEQRLQQPIPESLIDSVCHTAAEIFRARYEDKAQDIINRIREMLEGFKVEGE